MTPGKAGATAGPRLLSRAEILNERWSWRHDITAQVINTDIDGLLTACLLHDLKGWPVVGLYDTQRLWLDEGIPVPLDLTKYIWVDIDMCWPGTRCLSQHVILDHVSDVDQVEAFTSTINPSLAGGHSRRGNYRNKYPYGTFQWAWWLAKGARDRPQPSDRIGTGLAWMADGGFDSIMHTAWGPNCRRWATELLPGSLLEPLVLHDRGRSARTLVQEACEHLQRESGVRTADLWSNLQLNLTRNRGRGPEPLLDSRRSANVLQAVADAICDVFDWRRLEIPNLGEPFLGTWHSAPGAPPGWPTSTADFGVVSAAATGTKQFCWTSPHPPGGTVRRSLATALGAPRLDVMHTTSVPVEHLPAADAGSPRHTRRPDA